VSTVLRPITLDRATFAPFGDVIELDGATRFAINQGFAERFDDLAGIDVALKGGATRFSIFEAKPRPQPISIDLMERHPLGSQLFYPLQDRMWWIVVAADARNPSTYRAFAATGRQGVNYARNVWHFPLIVTGAGDRFIVVDRKGPGNNLEEVLLPEAERPLFKP
jgi:ureidoglycolate lyase